MLQLTKNGAMKSWPIFSIARAAKKDEIARAFAKMADSNLSLEQSKIWGEIMSQIYYSYQLGTREFFRIFMLMIKARLYHVMKMLYYIFMTPFFNLL